MPDKDSSERNDGGDDAAWRDLIARYDSPLSEEEPTPWPEIENAAAAAAAADSAAADTAGADSADASAEDGPAPERRSLDGIGTAGLPPGTVKVTASPAAPLPLPPSSSPSLSSLDEHFVPPPPPPLPKLDTLSKAAWVALFGGPGYLLIGTALGWEMPGVAVFCAVAAFVAGVAMLVFKLTDSDRDDSDDDGAVV